MELIEELHHPNILLLPIGEKHTMGPKESAIAATHYFKSAQHIVPMHFGTFPCCSGTWERFK